MKDAAVLEMMADALFVTVDEASALGEDLELGGLQLQSL